MILRFVLVYTTNSSDCIVCSYFYLWTWSRTVFASPRVFIVLDFFLSAIGFFDWNATSFLSKFSFEDWWSLSHLPYSCWRSRSSQYLIQCNKSWCCNQKFLVENLYNLARILFKFYLEFIISAGDLFGNVSCNKEYIIGMVIYLNWGKFHNLASRIF